MSRNGRGVERLIYFYCPTKEKPMLVTLKRTLILAILGLTVLGAACTPQQVEIFKSLTPEQQQTILTNLRNQNTQPSADCYQAIDKHWPASSRAWARQIVWRESRNIPSAANPRSTARGCGQLLLSLHSNRYYKVGCTPSQWANPDCNIKAMLDLYKTNGTQPWKL